MKKETPPLRLHQFQEVPSLERLVQQFSFARSSPPSSLAKMLLFKNLLGPKSFRGRENDPGIRNPQSVYNNSSFQDVNPPFHKEHFIPRLLDGFHRHPKCLPPHSCSSEFPKVPGFLLGKSTLFFRALAFGLTSAPYIFQRMMLFPSNFFVRRASTSFHTWTIFWSEQTQENMQFKPGTHL